MRAPAKQASRHLATCCSRQGRGVAEPAVVRQHAGSVSAAIAAPGQAVPLQLNLGVRQRPSFSQEAHVKRIGIVAHSAEGGALCFLTACREGQRLLGAHMHPEIVLSAVPMGLSMPGWESDDHALVAEMLRSGVEQVAQAGADFYVCPDNTAHIVLEQIATSLPIPGLHIAHVVCHEIVRNGWRAAGLLGTRWTMAGPVYAGALAERGLERLVPPPARREELNRAIFEELCLGRFEPATTDLFIQTIRELAAAGADCAILGCTEIPLIITAENSPLPVLDSTRLLAAYAVQEAVSESALRTAADGWVQIAEEPGDLVTPSVVREPVPSRA